MWLTNETTVFGPSKEAGNHCFLSSLSFKPSRQNKMLALDIFMLPCWQVGGGDGGGDIGEKAAKPVTTVQACVTTFVRVTSLDIFMAIFASTNVFDKPPGHL